LVDRSRFWQNGPASQHVRKKPTKNKLLVDFCFELTAYCLFSSDHPPSPISLVVHTKKVFPLPATIFPTYLFYKPRPPNHWLREADFGKIRKETNKKEFLVNFCFELTAQCLFSSDLPPSSISLVVHTKKVFPLP
jgi:hypothetical protein